MIELGDHLCFIERNVVQRQYTPLPNSRLSLVMLKSPCRATHPTDVPLVLIVEHWHAPVNFGCQFSVSVCPEDRHGTSIRV